MKKFLPYYILVIIIAVGLFMPTHFAHAQASKILSWIGVSVMDFIAPILSFIFYLIQKIIALFMGLTGLILNYTIDLSVVRMAENLTSMTGINIAWKVIRDLMNIGFIFLLVYQGILLIIGQGDVAKIRRFVLMIVLSSVLINFSLFFTKVIIDGSNIVTIGIYNSILTSSTGNNAAGTTTGLSDAFQQSLGLQSFYDTIPVGGGSGNYGGLIANICAAVLFLVAGFVFLAITVMFVVRYIVLIILLALSPVAFMGMSISQMKGYSDRSWNALWGQILFAPLFMLMVWVALTIMRSPGFLGSGQTSATWATLQNVESGGDLSGAVSLFFNFALVIGLTIASLVVSKSTATKGASEVGKMIGAGTTFAGNTLMGGSARIARNTVGRAGNSLAQSERLKDLASDKNTNWATRTAARATMASGNKAATSSLDVRASRPFQQVAKQTSTDFGKIDPKKQNFRKIREDQIKASVDAAKAYKPSDGAAAAATATLASDKFVSEERERELRNVGQQRQKAIETTKNIQTEAKEIQGKVKSSKDQEDILVKELAVLTSKPALTADEEKRKVGLTEKITRQKEETSKHAAVLKTKEDELGRRRIELENLNQQYQNTDEGRRRKEAEDAKKQADTKAAELQSRMNTSKAEQASLDAELSNLLAKPVKTDEDTARQMQISSRITTLKNLTTSRTLEIENYKKDSAKQEAEISKLDLEERLWMSEEKKRLIALKGGQKEERAGNNKDGEITKVGVQSAFANRLESIAAREEGRGRIWRYSANAIGIPLSAVASIKPKTKADRNEIARQIRKLKSEKTPEQELAESYKKLRKEAKKKGDPTYDDDDDKDEAEPVAVAAAPEPASAPEPQATA